MGVWSLKNDTTKSFGLNRRQYRELLWSWQEELFHDLVMRDFIFKGNTPKIVKFDLGEYVCSFVGGMGSKYCRRKAAIIKKKMLVKMSRKSVFAYGHKMYGL